ncbi:origin of replication binding protein [mine drainage metagenome]|uniref:Origin of replication binding protein n=1 Tax=mine drainage metagenome TaxID=410659 RepID=A0A1J5QA35_9ZZZZ
MKLSINNKIINKNETGHWTQAKGFDPVDISPEEFAEFISLGFAFSFQFAGRYRKADNFICSDIIAADIDDGMTLEEAMDDEFVLNNACLLYTTASHTPENHRFRLVFQLPHTITDSDQMRNALRGLVRKFPMADKANTDPARQFYGSKGCNSHIFGKVLSEENLKLLLGLGHEPINLPDRQDAKSGKSGFRSILTLEEDSEVRNARGEMVRLSDMESSKPVYCPFHHDKNPSAFTTASQSGVKGVHCSKCQETFWTKGKIPEPYDFLIFDKLIRKEVSAFVPSLVPDESGFFEHETTDPNVLISERYLPNIPLQNCITLIKSAKGTGKTEYLKRLVAEYKKQNFSILLVGHRRSLLWALSSSLGLQCYLDIKESGMFACLKVSKRFAVSVDSIGKMLKPNINKFDVVLIDESEQVFSHLISETIDVENRRKCYLLLQHYIHTAKAVVALDADINHITLDAIQRFGTKNPLSDRRLVLNEYKFPAQTVELYANENQVIADIFQSIATGERIFICSNSKKSVDALVLAIKDKHGPDFPLFWVTSENTGRDEVNNFLTEIKTEILKYQVVLVSPAMGTGIDITFPDEVSHVDGVYGLFEARINTHFDIDQQLSRVRHPKFVRVWISSETFNFETEIDPIKQELAESEIIPEVLTGYANTGLAEFNWNDPYLNLYATILAAQRASKNQLRKNFIELKIYNDWKIEEISKNQEAAAEGSIHAKRGEALRKIEYVERILHADVIDDFTVNELKRKSDSGKPLSASEKNSVDRYWIEKFYLTALTTDLILRDNEGKYREQILMMERIVVANATPTKNTETNAKVALVLEFLEISGILKTDSQFDTSLSVTNENLKNFVALCRRRKAKIERVLGTTLRKDFAVKPVSQLGYFLGLCGLKTVKGKPISVGNQKIYRYRLDEQCLLDAMEIIKKRQSRHDPHE